MSDTVSVSVPAQIAKAGVAAGTPEANPAVAAAVPANPNAAPSALGIRVLATPAAVSGARVAIQSVEADAPDGLVAKGSAQANTTLRLYLNQADIAEAKTQSDGRWSLTIKGGMSPGGYVIQADEINPGGATVVASANTPFEYPEAFAAAPSPTVPIAASTGQAASVAPSPADPVVASVQTSEWRLGTPYGLSAKATMATRRAIRRSSRRTGRKSAIPMSSFPARCSSSRSRTPNYKWRDAPKPSRRDAPRTSAQDIRRRARPSHRRHAHLGGARGVARRRRLPSV